MGEFPISGQAKALGCEATWLAMIVIHELRISRNWPKVPLPQTESPENPKTVISTFKYYQD